MNAAQRVQAKTVVFFNNQRYEFLCKPTNFWELSKKIVCKTPISLPIHIGRYFSASWKLNSAAAVTLLSMAGWWAVPANSKLFWITQIQMSDESRKRIPAPSHDPSVKSVAGREGARDRWANCRLLWKRTPLLSISSYTPYSQCKRRSFVLKAVMRK